MSIEKIIENGSPLFLGDIGMDQLTVLMNLALLIPMSVVGWYLVLPQPGKSVIPAIAWWVPFSIVVVSLGGFLAAFVASAFGETLVLAPFSWVERPLFAVQVITACACLGGVWSYGLACIVGRALSRAGWKHIPPLLVGTPK